MMLWLIPIVCVLAAVAIVATVLALTRARS